MTEIDPDFPYEFLDEDDNNIVRAPDAVIREQLIPTASNNNITNYTTNNNSISNNANGFYSNLPSNVFNMSIEEQIAYMEE